MTIMSSKRKSPPTKLSNEDLEGDGGASTEQTEGDETLSSAVDENYNGVGVNKGHDPIDPVLPSEDDLEYEEDDEVEDDEDDEDAMLSMMMASGELELDLRGSKSPASEDSATGNGHAPSKKRRLTASQRKSKHVLTSESDSELEASPDGGKMTKSRRLQNSAAKSPVTSSSGFTSMALASAAPHARKSMNDVLKRLTSKMHISSLHDSSQGAFRALPTMNGRLDLSAGHSGDEMTEAISPKSEPGCTDYSLTNSQVLKMALAADTLDDKERQLGEMISQLQLLKEQLISQQHEQTKEGLCNAQSLLPPLMSAVATLCPVLSRTTLQLLVTSIVWRFYSVSTRPGLVCN